MSLIEKYNLDPGFAYECNRDELWKLLFHFGETEPIIDALMVLDNQTVEARAEAIGCSPSDFEFQVWK